MKINNTQRAFLGTLLLSLCYLLISVVVNSSGRESILSANAAYVDDSTFNKELGSEGRFQLTDFHRIEVKDGKAAWEIRAKEAKYYPGDSVSHINDAMVKIYRENDSAVHLRSRSARLHIDGTMLGSAELEGNVSVVVDNSISVFTDFAAYDSRKRKINAPGKVRIEGAGYEVKGRGLDVYIDQDKLHISEDVVSRFNSEGSMPKLDGVLNR